MSSLHYSQLAADRIAAANRAVAVHVDVVLVKPLAAARHATSVSPLRQVQLRLAVSW